jgi:flagella basal body P-ring formation protein FlgA
MKFFFFISLLCVFKVGATEVIELSFVSSVNRLIAPIKFSDVVNVEGHDNMLPLKWPVQYRGWVSRHNIEALFNTSTENTFQWSGAKRVWVDWCHKPDENALQRTFKDNAGDFLNKIGVITDSLQLTYLGDFPCVKEKVVAAEWENITLNGVNKLSAKLRLSLQNKQSDISTQWIDFSAMGNVLVLSKNGKKDDLLSNLGLKKVISKWNVKQVTLPINEKSYRLKKKVASGQVITKGDIELIPDVEIGDTVNVIVESGKFFITTKGLSTTNGRIGDSVFIRIEGSHKITEAVVISEGMVRVYV